MQPTSPLSQKPPSHEPRQKRRKTEAGETPIYSSSSSSSSSAASIQATKKRTQIVTTPTFFDLLNKNQFSSILTKYTSQEIVHHITQLKLEGCSNPETWKACFSVLEFLESEKDQVVQKPIHVVRQGIKHTNPEVRLATIKFLLRNFSKQHPGVCFEIALAGMEDSSTEVYNNSVQLMQKFTEQYFQKHYWKNLPLFDQLIQRVKTGIENEEWEEDPIFLELIRSIAREAAQTKDDPEFSTLCPIWVEFYSTLFNEDQNELEFLKIVNEKISRNEFTLQALKSIKEILYEAINDPRLTNEVTAIYKKLLKKPIYQLEVFEMILSQNSCNGEREIYIYSLSPPHQALLEELLQNTENVHKAFQEIYSATLEHKEALILCEYITDLDKGHTRQLDLLLDMTSAEIQFCDDMINHIFKKALKQEHAKDTLLKIARNSMKYSQLPVFALKIFDLAIQEGIPIRDKAIKAALPLLTSDRYHHYEENPTENTDWNIFVSHALNILPKSTLLSHREKFQQLATQLFSNSGVILKPLIYDQAFEIFLSLKKTGLDCEKSIFSSLMLLNKAKGTLNEAQWSFFLKKLQTKDTLAWEFIQDCALYYFKNRNGAAFYERILKIVTTLVQSGSCCEQALAFAELAHKKSWCEDLLGFLEHFNSDNLYDLPHYQRILIQDEERIIIAICALYSSLLKQGLAFENVELVLNKLKSLVSNKIDINEKKKNAMNTLKEDLNRAKLQITSPSESS